MWQKIREYLDAQVTYADLTEAGEAAARLGTKKAHSVMLAVYDFFSGFKDITSYDTSGEQMIICPDCGKGIAFRQRCPKCGGASWVPAGHAGGVHERRRAQKWRELMDGGDTVAPDNVVEMPQHDEYEESVGNAGALA